MLKRTSGLNKLMSIVHRMSMELDSLRIKAETHATRGLKTCGFIQKWIMDHQKVVLLEGGMLLQ